MRDDERVAVVRRLQQRLLDEDPVRAARDPGLYVERDRLRQQVGGVRRQRRSV